MTDNGNYGAAIEMAARLLGPAGPELGCAECFESLDFYVELELAEADADQHVPGMRAHLDGCGACRDDHESLLALLRRHEGRCPDVSPA